MSKVSFYSVMTFQYWLWIKSKEEQVSWPYNVACGIEGDVGMYVC